MQKDQNKVKLENFINETNSKEQQLAILKRKIMIETNELNMINVKIEQLNNQNGKGSKEMEEKR